SGICAARGAAPRPHRMGQEPGGRRRRSARRGGRRGNQRAHRVGSPRPWSGARRLGRRPVAQVHRRLPRLSHHRLTRWTEMSSRRALPALFLASSMASVPALAQAPSAPPAASTLAEAVPGDVDVWLARLTGTDAAGRKAAIAALDGVTPGMLPAVTRRLSELKKSADRDGMAVVLTRFRKAPGPSASADLFERAMAAPSPGEIAWRETASVLGLSRMLVRMGT